MRTRSLGILAVPLCLMLAGVPVGCSDDDDREEEPSSLTGLWQVSDIKYDNSVVRTYEVRVEQAADSATIRRQGEAISGGRVVADTLFCSDWDGYGIRRIFIDSWSHLHSETPAIEYLNVILFDRIPEKTRSGSPLL